MRVDVNGTRLWFDVDGASLEPDGSTMRERPTVLLLHGGPGSYDHSYFKPDFSALNAHAQVVYLDLRDHGRSARHDPADWTFELCADDVRAFCDTIGINKPVVYGHSMGGFVAMLYAVWHPGHARALVLQSTNARFDLDRLVEGFRGVAGDEVAELARRSYSTDAVSDAQWARVFAAFGPRVPTTEQLARTTRNAALGPPGRALLRGFDVVDRLGRIDTPTLVCVGELDPVTPVDAAREIAAGLREGIGRIEVIPGAGHFPWLDDPTAYWPVVADFLARTTPAAG